MADKNPFFGATFAERKAARLAAEKKSTPATKAVDEDAETVEDKAVSPKKRTTKGARSRKST